MKLVKENTLFIMWIVAILAAAGSLFFSVIMEFVPCTLCWWQRITMYPLAAILLIGFYQDDKRSILYGAPFIISGWAISIYHNLVQLKVIPESASPCVSGVPCSEKWINWFGFISIPMLAFFAFTILFSLFLLEVYSNKDFLNAKKS
ncbi:disulfide oxidoreductase [Halobacteriovorax sp. HFRX-2_2]|uniref:disulfide oxidoreductase n=1 Tax=unclassified Halobacteriovorax TaxID=2639665 RepID=UPI0037101867